LKDRAADERTSTPADGAASCHLSSSRVDWINPNFGFFGVPAEIWRTNLSTLFPEFYDAALQQLISARRKARMTQMAVAKALGRPQSFVSKYESGERALDFAEFVMIARIVGGEASEDP